MKFPSFTASSVGAITLALAACCHSVPPPSANPPKVAGHPRVAIWLTDGSPSIFTDTFAFPGCSIGGLLPQPYEGLPDSVPTTWGTIPRTSGGYDGEAEFVIEFERPLAELPDINLNTPHLRLRGLIETKTLNRLTGRDNIKWAPSSIGNNLLTSAPGIPLPQLGDIDSDKLAKTSLLLSFTDLKARPVSHSATLADLPDKKLLIRYLRAVQEVCRDRRRNPEYARIQAVNLGAQGSKSGYVNEIPRIVGAAIRAVGCEPGCVFRRDKKGWLFPECSRRELIGKVIHSNAGAGPGKIKLQLTAASGASAGEATLEVLPR